MDKVPLLEPELGEILHHAGALLDADQDIFDTIPTEVLPAEDATV